MENLIRLTSLFSQHLDMNLARVKTLSMMILALLEGRDIRLSVLSRYFILTRAKADSSFKRMQRFIREVSIPQDRIARIVLAVMGFGEKEKLTLIFDRTNWKFGKTHINFLFLTVAHKGISIPIFWKVLRDKKQGNSSYLDRIELMERFIKVFGASHIECILGDREFVGKCWIMWVRRMRLPYLMRLPEISTYITNGQGLPVKAGDLFRGLRKGGQRSIGYCQIGIVEPYKSEVTVLRIMDNELVVLLHSERLENPPAKYLERWQIETMFRAFKTSGFNLESTHVSEPNRLSQLMGVLVLAFCFAYRAGKIVSAKKKSQKRITDILFSA